MYTGLNNVELKKWVLEIILPDLSVFMEWRSAMQGADNQSPSRDEVKKAMRQDFAVISLDPDEFVMSKDVTNRLIWAHTVHRVKNHLRSNETCKEHFPSSDALNNAGFDFLKFIIHNMSNTRCFGPNKLSKARESLKGLKKRKCPSIHRIVHDSRFDMQARIGI